MTAGRAAPRLGLGITVSVGRTRCGTGAVRIRYVAPGREDGSEKRMSRRGQVTGPERPVLACSHGKGFERTTGE